MPGWLAGALADLVLASHLAFVVFVAAGALLVLRWPRVAWVHVPAATWGAYIEFSGRICPLTPLEVGLRERAGEAGYHGDFLGHYVGALVYPAGLTRSAQFVLGVVVVAVNLAIYAGVCWRRRRRASRDL